MVQVIHLAVKNKKYMSLLWKYSMCVGNFGFTRPSQDYSTGPSTALEHK